MPRTATSKTNKGRGKATGVPPTESNENENDHQVPQEAEQLNSKVNSRRRGKKAAEPAPVSIPSVENEQPEQKKNKIVRKKTTESAAISKDKNALNGQKQILDHEDKGNSVTESKTRKKREVKMPLCEAVDEHTNETPNTSTKPSGRSTKKSPAKTKVGKKNNVHQGNEVETIEKTNVEKVKKPEKRTVKSKKTTAAPSHVIDQESTENLEIIEATSHKKKAKKGIDAKELPTTSNKTEVAQIAKKRTTKKQIATEQIGDGANHLEEDLGANGSHTPKKTVRGRKRVATKTTREDIEDGAKDIKTKKPLLNATETIYNNADFDYVPSADSIFNEKNYNLKISSWNVAGFRSWIKKDSLKFLDYEKPDILCLQEIKCTLEQLPNESRLSGYHPYWLCMSGGYAGVAIYSKIMPIHVEYGIGASKFDDVGRLITAEYEKFYLVNVYVPNSGRKLVNLDSRMEWEDLFRDYIQKLDQIKPVIICGDMNVSHKEIDLANPKANTRNAGFTIEERSKMTELLEQGFVDSFRHFYPNRTGAYTFWTYMGGARARNVGWRLDYFLVSERWIKCIIDNCIRSQVMGSDHCPITLFLKI